MSKKLSICITRYNEPWEICKNLFDSLAIQKGMSFDDVEILICNDGMEDVLPVECFADYPYTVKCIGHEKLGVSANRNIAMDNAEGEYIMFCDADDMFINAYSLHEILFECAKGFDYMCGCFIEEQPDPNGGWIIFNHTKDLTFIHGKVYNKQFLIDKELRFDEKLTMHEDGYFNTLVDLEATNKKMGTFPLYLWVWNEKSVIRSYGKEEFLFKTYPMLMEVRKAMARQIVARGFINEFYDNVVSTVINSYLDFQKPYALNKENEEVVRKAKKSFKKFYKEFGSAYKECDINRISDMYAVSRFNAYSNGLRLEQQTLRDFLNEIVSM